MADKNYKIVKSQLPLVGGIAGHNFIAVLNPEGQVIHELNGLAASKDGEIKPIGILPWDRLRVYDEKEAGGFYYHPSQNQKSVFEGSYTEVMNVFQRGLYLRDLINSKDFLYPPAGILGWNSNSVATTLLKGMKLSNPYVGGYAATPGENLLMINEREMEEYLKKIYDINELNQLNDGAGSAGRKFNVSLIMPEGIQNFECNGDKYILDGAEEVSIDLPYSCRTGSCSTCVGKVITGSISQPDQSFLDSDQTGNNFVCLCVAYPTSDCVIATHREQELID